LVGQVLLTHDDLTHRSRYLNARRTLMTLIGLGALPIVNENDTVAVEEIKVGDNDNLSAQVASLIEADLLIILTTVEGLLRDGAVVPVVKRIDKKVIDLAGGPGSSIGIGGMVTKLEAARLAGSMGIPTIVASGRKPNVLRRILDGEEEGTLFMPAKEKLAKRKHWIAWTQKPRGSLVVDDGARNALLCGGKSLLPKGIIEVRGNFDRGEAVSIMGTDGLEIARGLVEYSSADLAKIRGRHSKEIENALGYRFDDEAVHRDDMVISCTE
jgi:glutamate 5-kinase